MDLYNEKISLLSEMIAFSLVDDELHEAEINFLTNVSEELGINKADFLELFFKQTKPLIIKDQFLRILHFYQLAMLMHCDNKIHINENIAINEIGIKMGLCPNSMKIILDLMEKSTDRTVPIDVLMMVFNNQNN